MLTHYLHMKVFLAKKKIISSFYTIREQYAPFCSSRDGLCKNLGTVRKIEQVCNVILFLKLPELYFVS